MPAFTPREFTTTSNGTGSGITLALRDMKAGQCIVLSITKAAQEAQFGKLLETGDHLIVVLDNDPGKVHLMGLQLAAGPTKTSTAVSVSAAHGLATLKFAPWVRVAAGKRPPKAMPVMMQGDGKIMVKLPEWARPAPVKPHQGKSVMEG